MWCLRYPWPWFPACFWWKSLIWRRSCSGCFLQGMQFTIFPVLYWLLYLKITAHSASICVRLRYFSSQWAIFQSCVFIAMKANVFIVGNVCVSAQWMWRSIRNPANEREERSVYSVTNAQRSVQPKHCIKKCSWRYSCDGKVEFCTYTREIKDIIRNGEYDIL